MYENVYRTDVCYFFLSVFHTYAVIWISFTNEEKWRKKTDPSRRKKMVFSFMFTFGHFVHQQKTIDKIGLEDINICVRLICGSTIDIMTTAIIYNI